MMSKNLNSYFEKYLEQENVFKDKKVFSMSYTPETIEYRDEQIDAIANILAPALKLDKPSNLFIYGKTGTGKTLTVRYTTAQIAKVAAEKNIPVFVHYLNCKLKRVADTEYRLIAQLAREFGREIPPTGLPTDEVYKIFFEILDEKEQIIILILDEIDQLVKKAGDEILYNLTRINSELRKAQVTIIGVSNDLVFTDGLDTRVKSSLSEEEIVFPPYNAFQIQNILKKRAKIAFKPNVIKDGVIEKCAAYAAREHGDVRRAIELLRVAAELSERKGDQHVGFEHLDEAEDKIERDRVIDIISTQPKQFQALLYAVIKLSMNKQGFILTGEVYELYKSICYNIDLRPLTQRRISDVITELDMLGIINAKIISKGRFGRTREIALAIPATTRPRVQKILEEGLQLSA
ncbi:MAG TPA: ORC1-type DNA replication protein [Acidobacteriota bacterium]|nr:ORC1-type DNA replication protein [Acidobacteriota bacterium]